jgi:hypothetical protein
MQHEASCSKDASFLLVGVIFLVLYSLSILAGSLVARTVRTRQSVEF